MIFDRGTEAFEVADQLPRDQQRERMQRIGDRADRRRPVRAGVPRRQDDQPRRALFDRDLDRRVGGDRAVGEVEILVMDRREGAGDCSGGDDRLGRRPFRQHDAVAGKDVSRDDVDRKLGILQVPVGQMIVDYFSALRSSFWPTTIFP